MAFSAAAASADQVPFLEAIQIRRSTIALAKRSPISDDRIVTIVSHAVKYAPSSFHIQGARAIVLLGAEHDKLWDIALASCERRLPPPVLAVYKPKLEGYRDSYGTVLFFEDTHAANVLPLQLQELVAKFPEWREHSSGMAQYIVWTALCVEGLGCNLQHLQDHLNDGIAATWNPPATWQLRAQLVFGEPTGPPRGGVDKQFAPLEGRVLVYGK